MLGAEPGEGPPRGAQRGGGQSLPAELRPGHLPSTLRPSGQAVGQQGGGQQGAVGEAGGGGQQSKDR